MSTDYPALIREALRTAAMIGGLATFASLCGLGLYFAIMAFWGDRE
jgi:hypothetical protein